MRGRGLGHALGVAVRRSRPSTSWGTSSVCPACVRQFSHDRSSRAVAITTASSSDAEADARVLRALFDAPETSSMRSERTAKKRLSASLGLFGSPSLTQPSSFLELAKRTLLRAQLLVSRIVDAPNNGYEEMTKVVRNLDRLSDLLCGVIDCAELIRNAHPDREWVDAANEAYEYLCGYMNVLNTHTGLYEVLAKILSNEQLRSSLSPEATAVAYVFLRDFEKSGIHLPEAQRAKFVSLSDEILVLGRSFLQDTSQVASNDVLEMPLEWIKGIPGPITQAIRSSSLRKDDTLQLRKNSWEMQAVSKYAPDERARKVAHLGMNSGTEQQVGILERLLQRRGELAKLTGNDSFASMTLGDKMARKPENVSGFLASLSTHHRPLADRNLDQLRTLKAKEEGKRDFFAWDRDYYAEHYMRAMSLQTSTPPINGFFSVGTVFAGLSRLFERLYGISLRAAEVSEGEVWAEDVCRMDVVEEGNVIGTIYADLYNRRGKPSSAAHYTVRCSRRTDEDDELNDFRLGKLENGRKMSVEQGQELTRTLDVKSVPSHSRPGLYQLPIVVLLCDFVRPTLKSGPSLLNWHEVETLFHEMGHAIHSMIGRTEYHNVSGTRCATDFVELPSILMEHFLSSPEVIGLVARHHATDAPLPYHHLTSYLQSARSLDSLDVHNQILLASLDQVYHSPLALEQRFDSTQSLQVLQDKIGIIPAMKGVTWQVNFGHLFGYGATYYSYLFDRVIAARVWKKLFTDDPLSREQGEIFKNGVLAHGGGRDPWSMLANVLQDEEIANGAEDARAMQAVG
ncbi:hypothetical protein CBS101457_002295 [Exobasidium rhododendri]|nr:hypothetical protein CBS101457_002295 [Exobasidium rhododendri]